MCEKRWSLLTHCQRNFLIYIYNVKLKTAYTFTLHCCSNNATTKALTVTIYYIFVVKTQAVPRLLIWLAIETVSGWYLRPNFTIFSCDTL